MNFPKTKLHAVETAGTVPALNTGTVEIIQRNGSSANAAILSILGGTAGFSVIDFGDSNDIDVGRIVYNHTTNAMELTAATTQKLSLGSSIVINDPGEDIDTRIEGDTDTNLLFVDASADRVGIGVATPANKLEVNGTIQADGLRLDVSPTAEAIVPTHTITISVNGTNYKIPIVAA